MNKSRYLALVLAVPLLFATAMSHAAVFMKIDGVDGESTDEQHPGAIDVLSWSWGASNIPATAGGGGGAGKVSFQDFHFTRRLDKSSPILALACATGQHIKDAVLTCRKSGGGQDGYYVITLHDVLVTGISCTGDSSDDRPMETISLNFTKIEWRYVPTEASGEPGTPVVAGWDIAANTPLVR